LLFKNVVVGLIAQLNKFEDFSTEFEKTFKKKVEVEVESKKIKVDN